jgi:hypothetical protein
MQICQVKSESSQTHGWVMYCFGDILGSVGHRVKIHKITLVTGKERGDLEIKDDMTFESYKNLKNRLIVFLLLVL